MAIVKVESGPWAGWMHWTREPEGRFVEQALGVMYFRDEPDGRVRCRIETGKQHTNLGDDLHGAFIMAVADMVYFALGWRSLEAVPAVTLTANFEFISPGRPGQVLEAVGEVLRETRRLLFVRAVLQQDGHIVANTSATLRKIPAAAGKDSD